MKRRTLEKIGYFFFGGIVATIGYIAGNMDSSIAQQGIGHFEKLFVEETIIVGDISKPKKSYVGITATEKSATVALVHNHPRNKSVTHSDASASIHVGSSDVSSFAAMDLVDKSGGRYSITSYSDPVKVSRKEKPSVTLSQKGTIIVEVITSQPGFVDDNIKILSAVVKMSNSKRIHVDFSNPPTIGVFDLNDKIRIKQKGTKWEFIEHIP